jgi:ComEC/Rec2-related protein
MVHVAVLYACGLLLAEFANAPLPWLFGLALSFALLAAFSSRARPWLLIPLVVCTGWVNLASRTAIVAPHDLRVLLHPSPDEVSIRGTLTETPSVRTFIRDDQESFRTLAIVNVIAAKRGADWVPAFGTVMCVTPGALNGKAYAGSAVELSGIIEPPPQPVAPGLFDYRKFLERQGIYFQLRVSSTNAWQVSGSAAPPLSDRFIAWAERTLSRGLPVEDEPLRLLCAMTLGTKTGLTNDVYEPFMLSGTMHIFAISGLHIALIAGLLVTILRVLQIPRHWCGLVVIPLIWFYTGGTGWQASAIRSTIMMSVIIIGWSLRRPSELVNSLAVAALLILAWQPQQLFQASFQLSFFVVLSIALLLPPLEKMFHNFLKHDPLLPRSAVPRWRRWLEIPLRWLALSFATSLAAWLGALPLTAQYFNIFSPVTLLANLVIVPLSSAALACNLGSLLCGDWLPWVGVLFNHAAWFWMLLMVRISEWCTLLPGAFYFVSSPPAWSYCIYYVLLVGSSTGWLLKVGKRRWGAALGTAALVMVGWQWHLARTQFDLTVLPLNGGHAVYVDGPGRSDDWLVDCGNSNSVQFVTRPFLRTQGVNRIPRLALTHGDLQHVGGTTALWTAIPIERIYTSSVRFRSAAYRRILNGIGSRSIPHKTVAGGSTAGCWTVLHPDEIDRFPQADDASLVLLGEFFGKRILLLGDLGRQGQEALLKRCKELKADIVITGLASDSEPLSNGLIAAASPSLIIVADSEFPATARASPELRTRLAVCNIPVIYTRDAGAVTLSVRPDSMKIQTSRTTPFMTK